MNATTLHIFHTNDFHNHLTPTQADYIRQQREQFPHSLLLDAGDAISAGNMGVRPGGEPILTLMSEAGYDAMTLGNREFHVADTMLRAKLSKATFPILCANARWKEDKGAVLPFVSHIVKDGPDGLRIGIFGLTVPMVTERMAARNFSAFLFDDPVDIARRELEILRPQCDIVAALTHIGIREDERLAHACPELDVLIGGHSHVSLPAPQLVGDVPIAQAGWYGHSLGHMEIEWDGSRVVSVTGRLWPLKDATGG